jgi:hypothetical protein
MVEEEIIYYDGMKNPPFKRVSKMQLPRSNVSHLIYVKKKVNKRLPFTLMISSETNLVKI